MLLMLVKKHGFDAGTKKYVVEARTKQKSGDMMLMLEQNKSHVVDAGYYQNRSFRTLPWPVSHSR